MPHKINVREARQNISKLLDAIAAGDEFIITRRNKPAAKLSKVDIKEIEALQFPDRKEFRAQFTKCRTTGSRLISEMRNGRG